MGEVWAATHTITGRRFALKFLKGQASLNLEMRQRFFREARAASLVDHPSVVNVLDVFALDGGMPVMVMDLLVGETLGAKLERDRVLPQEEAASILSPVVDAVSAAHARGIVHRDLKPDNIFLEAKKGGPPTVKVLDFGIAKLTAQEGDAAQSGALTMSGALLGTPRYMAPEQCYGEGEIDPRADVWALGAILYECISGQRPVEGANLGQVVTKMLKDEIVPIEERTRGLDPELARLIGRMLAHKRDDRPSDLSEVQRSLARIARDPVPSPSSTHELEAIVPTKTGPASPPSESVAGESLGPLSGKGSSSPRLRFVVLAGLALTGAVSWKFLVSAKAPVTAVGSPPSAAVPTVAPVPLAPPPREVAPPPSEAPAHSDPPRTIAGPSREKRSHAVVATSPHDNAGTRRPPTPAGAPDKAASPAAPAIVPTAPPKQNRPHKGLVEEVPF
jgi:serine/threonine-protein kinase